MLVEEERKKSWAKKRTIKVLVVLLLVVDVFDLC